MADRPKDPRRVALNKVMAALDILPENERDRVLKAVNTLYGYKAEIVLPELESALDPRD